MTISPHDDPLVRAFQQLADEVDALKRAQLHLRDAIVTDDDPLSIAIGGATASPITGVRTLQSGLAIGDKVKVITSRNSPIVLGKIVDNA